MDRISTNLASTDLRERQAALEQLYNRLTKGRALELKPNVLVVLISNTLNCLKDNGAKVVLLCLDCIKMFLELHSKDFQPILNMSFDMLITKYADGKTSVRNKATELMVYIIRLMGIPAGIEKLCNQLYTKSIRSKENIMFTIMIIHRLFGDEFFNNTDILVKLAALLSDNTESIRVLAVDAFALFAASAGDNVLTNLQVCGVRSDKIDAISERVNSDRYLEGMAAVKEVYDILNENNAIMEGIAEREAMFYGTSGETELSNNMAKMSVNTNTSPRGTMAYNKSAKNRRVVTAASPSTLSSSSKAATFTGAYGQDSPTAGAASPSTGQGTGCLYDPINYLNLLTEGSWPAATKLYSEKEMVKVFDRATACLTKEDDWQDRMKGLGIIQALALGDGMEFQRDFINNLKRCHETLIAQISDLRSVLSKEGCRTVAILAKIMGNSFTSLAELLVPSILKLVVLKIRIMASAADRAMRIILSAVPQGYPKLLPLLLESCTGKNATLRRSAFEYLCMCVALWKTETLDKFVTSMKKAIKTGISDADAGVRKASRHLYWVLQSRSSYGITMRDFLDTLGGQAQRHLHTEYTSSTGNQVVEMDLPLSNSPQSELEVLLSMSRNCPAILSNTVDLNEIITFLETNSTGIESPEPGQYNGNDYSSKESIAGGRNTFPPRNKQESGKTGGRTQNLRKDMDGEAGGIDNGDIVEPYVISESTLSQARQNKQKLPRSSTAPSGGSVTSTTYDPSRSDGYSIGGNTSLGAARRLGGPTRSKTSSNRSRGGNIGNTTSSVPPDPVRISFESVEDDDVVHNRLPAPASDNMSLGGKSAPPLPAELTRTRGVSDNATVFTSNSVPEGNNNNSNALRGATRVLGNKPTSMSSAGGGAQRVVKPVRQLARQTAQRTTGDVGPEVSVGFGGGGLVDAEATRNMISNQKVGEETYSPVDKGDDDLVAMLGGLPQVVSLGEIRGMAEDEHWLTRLKAFSIVNQRLSEATGDGSRDDYQLVGAHMIEGYLELAIVHLGDTHQKVAAEILNTIQLCMEKFSDYGSSKLGVVLAALFHRLADRRQAVREQANTLLNTVRVVYDPEIVVAALSPKITELPDRIKTAVIQFLGVTVPHCGNYFNNPSNTWVFLGRMASVLSTANANTKPSTTLVSAGRRLLELVYNVAPMVVCSQIAALPLQQQSCLKHLLENCVQDIDALVSTASKAPTRSSANAEDGNGMAQVTSLSTDREDQETLSTSDTIGSNIETVEKTPIQRSEVRQMDSSNRTSETAGKPKASPVEQSARDISWLLESLGPSSLRKDKQEAVREVKRLAKSGESEFWRRNFAQIVSVLLEIFHPSHAVSSTATIESKTPQGGHAFNIGPDGKPFPTTGYTPINESMPNGNVTPYGTGSGTKGTTPDSASGGNPMEVTSHAESMHLSCKALLLLVRHRSDQAKVRRFILFL